MSFDDRLIRGLRTVEREATPDEHGALAETVTRGRTKRARRLALVSSASVAVTCLIVVAAVSVLRAPVEPRFDTDAPGGARGERVPEAVRHRYAGATTRVRVATVEHGALVATVYAYVHPREGRPCLVLDGVMPDVSACFEPVPVPSGLHVEQMVIRRDGTLCSGTECEGGGRALVWGSTAVGVAAVRADDRAIIPVTRLPEIGTGVFAGLITLERADEEADVSPLGSTGEPFAFPRCSPDQYKPHIDITSQSTGGVTTVVHVALQMWGPASPFPCRLRIDSTLTLEDQHGRRLTVDGNAVPHSSEQVVWEGTRAAGYWDWRNWCGQQVEAVAVARLSDGRVVREPVRTPGCFDPDTASTLTLNS